MEREPEEPTTFSKEVIEEIYRLHTDARKPRPDVVQLTAELIRLFVHEGCHRAAEQASLQDAESVNIEHFEKILGQLLMDF